LMPPSASLVTICAVCSIPIESPGKIKTPRQHLFRCCRGVSAQPTNYGDWSLVGLIGENRFKFGGQSTIAAGTAFRLLELRRQLRAAQTFGGLSRADHLVGR